jgi:hypothetical protein
LSDNKPELSISHRKTVKARIPMELEVKKSLLNKLKFEPDFRINVLENHHLFDLLRGNPHSITIMARLKSGDKKIKEIYNLL